jgi:hypothetical protein
VKWLLVCALVSGCAPVTQKMADADRKAIRVASINPNVTKPPEPHYLGPGGGAGLAFGALGAIVPVLWIECTMVDAGGKTAWSAGDRLLTLGNPIEGQPGDQLRNVARAIENILRAAATHIAANIAKEL